MAISEAIRRRRTHRSFTGDAIDFAHLSTILFAANGVTTEEKVCPVVGEPVSYHYRTTASAGGLYPIEVMVVACNVRGLSKGIFRHDALRGSVDQLFDSERAASVVNAICLPENIVSVSRAAAVILLVAYPWRSMRKYGARGMRFVFLEAGAIAQNIALSAGALGYGIVPCASIYDDEVHELLNLDGVTGALVHAVILGCPG
jgi:SagB-type dehydrogenase family enzyme